MEFLITQVPMGVIPPYIIDSLMRSLALAFTGNLSLCHFHLAKIHDGQNNRQTKGWVLRRTAERWTDTNSRTVDKLHFCTVVTKNLSK